MISIILLSGAQVFLYPEGLNSIWVRPEIGASLTFLLSRRKAFWERMAPDSHRSKTEHWPHSLPFLLHCTTLHILTRPSLSPGNLKIPIWPCNVPCGQSLEQTQPGSFCLPACGNALPPVFPLIISSPLLRTMQIFVMFLAWKMILRKIIQCLYLASLESKQKILYFAQTCQLLHFNYSGFLPPRVY